MKTLLFQQDAGVFVPTAFGRVLLVNDMMEAGRLEFGFLRLSV